jgi:hypothetical protein
MKGVELICQDQTKTQWTVAGSCINVNYFGLDKMLEISLVSQETLVPLHATNYCN